MVSHEGGDDALTIVPRGGASPTAMGTIIDNANCRDCGNIGAVDSALGLCWKCYNKEAKMQQCAICGTPYHKALCPDCDVEMQREMEEWL